MAGDDRRSCWGGGRIHGDSDGWMGGGLWRWDGDGDGVYYRLSPICLARGDAQKGLGWTQMVTD